MATEIMFVVPWKLPTRSSGYMSRKAFMPLLRELLTHYKGDLVPIEMPAGVTAIMGVEIRNSNIRPNIEIWFRRRKLHYMIDIE